MIDVAKFIYFFIYTLRPVREKIIVTNSIKNFFIHMCVIMYFTDVICEIM